MNPKTNKLSAAAKWMARRLTWLVVILVVFLLGYWLRGSLTPPTTTPPEASAPGLAQTAPQWWTCSMHPQIKLPKPGLCPICHMDLIPLEKTDLQADSLREVTVSESAQKLMDIQTVPVERRFVTAQIRMVGKVDYDETRLKYITAWIPGRLDRLFVDYTGVPVNQGDHLVSLYSPELLGAQQELIQALQAADQTETASSPFMRDSAQNTVTAAREKLRLWGLTPDQIAEIESRGQPTDHMTIYAPAGGIVIQKNARQGMYVQTGTQIYTIADLSVAWVRLDAYEADLMWLRYGQPVEFTSEAYPGEIFTGTIAFIDPILNETTRTVKIRVNAPNVDLRLKPGMFVRATVYSQFATAGRVMDSSLAGKWICPMHPDVIKDLPGACDLCEMPLVRTESLGYVGVTPTPEDMPLVIPASAALITGTRAIVYVKVPDQEKPTFEGREIVLGPRAGDYYLVRHGLQEGERVVTKGNFKLDATLQIQAQPSMMTPEAGGGGAMPLHDHGQPKDASAKTQTPAPEMELPQLFRDALQRIRTAADTIPPAISSENLQRIHAAFASLQQALDAVNPDQLTGHPALLWKEYAMLLTNDAVEGQIVKDLNEAHRVSRQLHEHLALMKSKFLLSPTMAHALPEQPKLPPLNAKFQQQFQPVIAGYLVMAQALADDDATGALAAAKQTQMALTAVDMKLLEGDSHNLWMELSQPLPQQLNTLLAQTEIEPLRKHFALLSEQFTAILTQFPWTELPPLYELNCPMAFDNRGAVWLQDHTDTRNPYFGAAMLKCGSIVNTFAPPVRKGDQPHGH